MKTRPISFSTEMVQAILLKRKKITRRLNAFATINEFPDIWKFIGKTPEHEVWHPTDKGMIGYPWFEFHTISGASKTFIVQCPYGKIGDILWVKETAKIVGIHGITGFHLEGQPPVGWKSIDTVHLEFVADKETKIIRWSDKLSKNIDCGKTLSSRFMPKVAARIFLKVTDIRVERLQNISEGDSMKEGVIKVDRNFGSSFFHGNIKEFFAAPIEAFKDLWCVINGIGSWDANPWVWVISFERCEKPEGFAL